MATSNSSSFVDLFGWDSAFAIRYAVVNAAIKSAGSSPKQFSQSDDQDGYSVSGLFGDWAVIPGGAGDLLKMEIPFHDVILRSPNQEFADLQGRVEVILRLRFVPQSASISGVPQQTTGVSQKRQLIARTSPQDAEKAVSVDHLSYAGAPPTFIVQVALKMLLEQWLNDHLDSFHHVFAVAELNRKADKDGFQWLQPTTQAYACADLGSNDGIFAILSMTGQRVASGLPNQISPYVIPDDQTATMAISGNRILNDMLLGRLPRIFSGAKLTDFKLSDTLPQTIDLAMGPIDFTATDPKSGKSQVCKLTAFQASIFGDEIRFDATTCVKIQIGVHVYTRVRSTSTIIVDQQQRLGYQTAPCKVDHWKEESEGLEIAEGVLAALALIVGILAVVLTDGAALLVDSLILGLVAGGLELATKVAESRHGNDAPSITPMAENAVASVQWAGSSGFKLTSASLNGSLQLSGDLLTHSSPT